MDFSALIDAFDIPLPPARPVLVEERLLLSPIATKQNALANRLSADGEAKFAEWQSHIDRVRAKVAAIPKPYPRVQLEQGEQAVSAAEEYAEALAIDVARLEKRIRRDVKRQFAQDPSLGAVTRAFGQKLVALEKRKVESLLDIALFIRADLALASPDYQPGEEFSDPSAFLRSFETRQSA